MRFKKNFYILLLSILGLTTSILFYYKHWGKGLIRRYYRLKIEIEDSDNVILGTPVLINGVKVGIVQDIYLGKDCAIVVLAIEKNVKIPKGSEVSVNYRGFMGDLAVNIFRNANNEFYKDNEVIRASSPISAKGAMEKLAKTLVNVQEKIENVISVSEVNISNKFEGLNNLFHFLKDGSLFINFKVNADKFQFVTKEEIGVTFISKNVYFSITESKLLNRKVTLKMLKDFSLCRCSCGIKEGIANLGFDFSKGRYFPKALNFCSIELELSGISNPTFSFIFGVSFKEYFNIKAFYDLMLKEQKTEKGIIFSIKAL